MESRFHVQGDAVGGHGVDRLHRVGSCVGHPAFLETCLEKPLQSFIPRAFGTSSQNSGIGLLKIESELRNKDRLANAMNPRGSQKITTQREKNATDLLGWQYQSWLHNRIELLILGTRL